MTSKELKQRQDTAVATLVGMGFGQPFAVRLVVAASVEALEGRDYRHDVQFSGILHMAGEVVIDLRKGASVSLSMTGDSTQEG